MRRKGLKKNKKGFTLVEIIVVLVIIGLLLALAVPAVMKYIGQAADTKVESQVRAGYVAAQTVVTSKLGENPAISEDDLKKLVTGESGVKAVNEELGLAYDSSKPADDNQEGAISKIECDMTSKKVDKCVITVSGSTDTWTATRTSIEKDTK